MPGDTHRAPLTSWSRPVAAATALAYRRSPGRAAAGAGGRPRRPCGLRRGGGRPERAKVDVPLIVSAAARDHPDWFWRPARERIEREEAAWRARGVWPPLLGARGGPPDADAAAGRASAA